jgi:cell volume regulation protein A
VSDVESFGLVVLVAGVVITVAVLANRISVWVRVPAAAIFLLGAALVSDIDPALYQLRKGTVEEVVTVALVVILFDGGMDLGWRRFREAAAAAALVGVAGTLVTAAGMAVLAHLILGLDWLEALLIGIAVAPTDPAVVFSVLGNRQTGGRSGTVLMGEAGLNDPVGIALMVSVLAAAGASGGGGPVDALVIFVLQMVVGALVGAGGGKLLVEFMRRVPLPAEALHPLRALAGALVIYGAATVAHGSGFLAVFVAGMLIGDAQAPFKREVERFHDVLASLAEITAFVALGVTVPLSTVARSGEWVVGLELAALLVFVVRPLLVGPLLLPLRLSWGERAFVLWSGLKGAVPILLAVFVVVAGAPNAGRIYDIVFVVVAFSVIVQGSLIPIVASALRVPAQAPP